MIHRALALLALVAAACGSSPDPDPNSADAGGDADADLASPDADTSEPDAALPPRDPQVALEWWDAIGSDGADWGGGVVVDDAGNVYLAASFSGTVTIGDQTLESAGSTDVAVVKYGADGQVDWVRHYGSAEQDEGASIAFDASGNLVVAGSFRATMEVGDTVLASAGDADVYLLELSPAGEVAWARSYGGTGLDYPTAIAVRGSTIAVTGGYGDSGVDFGGGALPGSQYGSLYVLVVDDEGNHAWSVGFGADGVDQGHGVAIDGAGGVVVAGSFEQTVDFGDGVARESQGGSDMVVARYEAPGTLAWVKTFGGTAYDSFDGLAVDGDDALYAAGHFRYDVSFDEVMLSSADQSALAGDAVLVKLGAGGDVQWAVAVGSAGNDRLDAVTLDGWGRPIVAGHIEGEIDLGSGALAGADEDFFLARFDADGEHLFSTRVVGAGFGLAKDVAINAAGQIAAATDSYGALSVGGEETPYAGGYDLVVLTFHPSGE